MKGGQQKQQKQQKLKQKQQKRKSQRKGGSLLGDIALPAIFLAANTMYGKKRTVKARRSRKFRASRKNRK
jgi:hypothetical protein